MKNKNKMIGEKIGNVGSLSACLLAIAALLLGASPASAQVSLGAASEFTVLSAAPEVGGAVTFTDATIIGDVGSSGIPAAVVQTGGLLTGVIVAPVSAEVLADFHSAYNELATAPCDQLFPATLADITLSTGVYCFDAAATLSGVMTLKGPSNGIWVFRVGTGTTGALTGTGFSVVLADGAQASNVYWRVAEAVTMTTSNLKGTVLAGAGITFTGGTFNGRAMAKAAVTLTGVAASNK